MCIDTFNALQLYLAKEIYKTYPHNPPHLFRENAIYFITGSTYRKVHHFESPIAKTFLRDSIFRTFGEAGWTIIDWEFGSFRIMFESKTD